VKYHTKSCVRSRMVAIAPSPAKQFCCFRRKKHYIATIESFAVKFMLCHDDVQLADEIKSTKFRWKFTTFSMVLHQTLSRQPMTSQIKKRGSKIAVWLQETTSWSRMYQLLSRENYSLASNLC